MSENNSHKLVLVIEDEKPLLEPISEILKLNGFKVATARSVEEAESALDQNPNIGVIWLDHYLFGKEDGLDFVTKLKHAEEKYRHIPVFVVSNSTSGDKISAYLKLGIDEYYTKSKYRLDEIIADIKRHLS